MSEHMKVYEQVRDVPSSALKKIEGGRLKGMSDINPMWRIKTLTEVFGICGFGWKTEIVNQRFEQGAGDVIACFVDINLFVKMDGEWSAPIPGMGGSSFVAMEKGALHTSDECFKMAYTDAISVACKSLGFAADVYFANDRTKYTDNTDAPRQTQSQPRTDTQQRPEANPPTNQQNTSQTNTGGSQRVVGLISEAQIKYINTLRSSKHISDHDYRRILAEIGNGKTSLKEYNKTEASKLVEFLKNYVAQDYTAPEMEELPF